MGLGTRGTQRPCQHHLPEELNRKREALQLPLNPASASMRTLSHPIVKNWPETKGSQADKYSRLGLGKSWGFLYAHVTFEAVFRSLIPLAIWHICSLCFSFLVFFFLEAKFWLFFQEGRSKRASGTAGRPEGGSGTNIFTDHLPHSVQGHDHIVKQPRVRGERADADHGLLGPTGSWGPRLLSRPFAKSGFQ